MQITIARPDDDPVVETFTLMIVGVKYRSDPSAGLTLEVDPDSLCPICSTRVPVWFIAAQASRAAMDPDQSPVGAAEICEVCLNGMIESGQIEITEVDSASF